MNLDAIKSAVESGKKVYWSNPSYEVIKDSVGQWLIKHSGGHCIGLASKSGVLNGKEEDFFTVDKDEPKVPIITLKPVRVTVQLKATVESKGKEWEMVVEYDEIVNMGTADYTIAFPTDFPEDEKQAIQDQIDQIPFDTLIENQ